MFLEYRGHFRHRNQKFALGHTVSSVKLACTEPRPESHRIIVGNITKTNKRERVNSKEFTRIESSSLRRVGQYSIFNNRSISGKYAKETANKVLKLGLRYCFSYNSLAIYA